MSEELTRAKRYRERAEEVRTIANGCRESQTAGQLRQVADTYEKMARTLETIDKTNQALGRS